MAYEVWKKVFVCYAHEDKKHLDLIRKHVKSAGLGWEAWDDSQIPTGVEWHKKIEVSLRDARAAVLLVSIDFVNSTFIQRHELPALMERAKSDRFPLIAVQLRPTIEQPALSAYQFLNDPTVPISAMDQSEQEELWVKLANRLAGVELVEEAGSDEEETTDSEDDDDPSYEPRMRPVAKKLLKALVGFQKEVRGSDLNTGVISYRDLFRKAGLGFTRRWAGRYLYEIHEWCRANDWPPLNALVVNDATRRPGGSYPGDNWEREARDSLDYSYPKSALSPP